MPTSANTSPDPSSKLGHTISPLTQRLYQEMRIWPLRSPAWYGRIFQNATQVMIPWHLNQSCETQPSSQLTSAARPPSHIHFSPSWLSLPVWGFSQPGPLRTYNSYKGVMRITTKKLRGHFVALPCHHQRKPVPGSW